MTGGQSRPEELDRAIGCARAHPRAGALGAFACDVLGAQAEGRTLFAGQKFMAQRAQAHGLDGDAAATDLGNLLSILERGPSDGVEHALVSAFAAHGLGLALAAEGGQGRAALVDKWIGALDWLETSTRYRVWPCLVQLADASLLAQLCDGLTNAVLRDAPAAVSGGPDEPLLRARMAARIAMLRLSPAELAKVSLTRLRDHGAEPASRALAAIALGEPYLPAKSVAVRVFGPSASITRSPLRAFVRVVTGYALAHAAVRALGFIVRLRRELELELEGRVLRERRRTWLMGRIVRSREALYPVERVRGAARSGRYALVRTLSGLLSLSLGVLVGGHFLFDAARGGAAGLLSVAALGCGLGAALDLGLDVLSSVRQRHVRLQVDLDGARSLALAHVPSDAADAFLDTLDTRLSSRAG